MLGVGIVVALAFSCVFCVPRPVSADARSEFLMRALRSSTMFRVRAQAALSLGAVQEDPAVTEALVAALSDENAIVRASAASALERHGDPEALSALREIRNDDESTVRRAVSRAIRALERAASSRTRAHPIPAEDAESPDVPDVYYVGVGVPGSRADSVEEGTLSHYQEVIANMVGALPGVVLAPAGESSRAARRVIRRGRLSGYFLDSSIVSVQETEDGGLRVRVSVILQSYPDRNIRSMLSGAATLTHAQGADAQRQATEAAFQGALRNLPRLLESGRNAGR